MKDSGVAPAPLRVVMGPAACVHVSFNCCVTCHHKLPCDVINAALEQACEVTQAKGLTASRTPGPPLPTPSYREEQVVRVLDVKVGHKGICGIQPDTVGTFTVLGDFRETEACEVPPTTSPQFL